MENVFVQSAENKLSVHLYPPKKEGTSTFIINSALGTKQTYYRHFANYLSEKGIRVLTYDYSGIGESAPNKMKGFKTSLKQWGQSDLTTIIEYVAANFSSQKIILVGQSAGGQVMGLSPSITKVHALVNVACQTAYWKKWPMPNRYVLLSNFKILTMMTNSLGYFPGKRLRIMEDLPKEVALEWAKWGQSPNYLFDHITEIENFYKKLKIPLLAYSFSDDRSAPKETVEWLNAKYENCQVTHKHYKPSDIGLKKIGHFGFFRKKCQVLWEDMLSELER